MRPCRMRSQIAREIEPPNRGELEFDGKARMRGGMARERERMEHARDRKARSRRRMARDPKREVRRRGRTA